MAKTKNPEDVFITIAGACGILDVTPTTIYDWIKDGKLDKHSIFGRTVLKRVQIDALAKDRSSK